MGGGGGDDDNRNQKQKTKTKRTGGKRGSEWAETTPRWKTAPHYSCGVIQRASLRIRPQQMCRPDEPIDQPTDTIVLDGPLIYFTRRERERETKYAETRIFDQFTVSDETVEIAFKS